MEEMKPHTRIAEINKHIKEADRMSKEVMRERRDKSGSFMAASFTAAMNWLVCGDGLRVLTPGEKQYAEMLYGPING